jgi:hypothetical protein
MPNREKRLAKGIESIEKQIEIHKAKLAKSRVEGSLDLERYYEKEILSLEEAKSKKKTSLKK